MALLKEERLGKKNDIDKSEIHVLKHLDLRWFRPDFVMQYIDIHKRYEPEFFHANLTVREYLKTIGAAVMSECDGTYHPTVAGLLMFGNKSTIDQMCDGFLLDYREIEDGKNNSVYSEMCSSPEWAGNLFEFYLWTFERIRSNVLETCVELEDYPDYYVLLDWMIVVALTNYNYWSGDGLIIENRKKEIMIEVPGEYLVPGMEETKPKDLEILACMLNRIKFSNCFEGEQFGEYMSTILSEEKRQCAHAKVNNKPVRNAVFALKLQ